MIPRDRWKIIEEIRQLEEILLELEQELADADFPHEDIYSIEQRESASEEDP